MTNTPTKRSCILCGIVPITPKNKSGRCRGCTARWLSKQPWFQEKRLAGIKGYDPTKRTTCASCSGKLSRRNRSGFCLPCFNRDPAHASRRGAGVSQWRKRKMDEDPAFAAKAREHGAWLGKSGRGNATTPAGSEPRKRAGKTLSNRYLGWCPESYRAEYRRLLHNGHYSAGRARDKILQLIEADNRAERDRIAAMSPFERQMHALSRGAGLVEVPIRRSTAPDFTLGGVTDWAA